MKPVVCFGELLLRMSPLPDAQWIYDSCLPVYLGGAELNVAHALAAWQTPVKYVTALPVNSLSQDVCKVLASKKIDVNEIHFSGNRIGVCYLTQGADLKHTSVIYDRAYSSFSELKPGMINWDEVLKDVSWFHFSAISPALNADAAKVCAEALQIAIEKNITISVDLNYRAKLWQYGKQPVEVMPELVAHCDVIMGNIWSANSLLGVAIDATIHDKKSKAAYIQHAAKTASEIMKRFPKCKTVAQTFRFDHNEGVIYYTTLHNAHEEFVTKEYCIEKITDKVGSGDCFMAGLIYGLSNKQTLQTVINFAAAAAIGKMNETGDATNQTIEMVKQTMNNQ